MGWEWSGVNHGGFSVDESARELLEVQGMKLTTNDFLAHVASHAPLDREAALGATTAVLSAIGKTLSRPTRELLAEELDPQLAEVVERSGPVVGEPDPETIVSGLPAGRAREVVASVCRVLVEELSEEVIERLRRELPVNLASWLEQPGPAREAGPRPHPRHLTDARPGSTHPVSETGPLVQEHSIAEGNPHGESKLSSTTGSTQERAHETLAEGHDPRT